MKIGDQLGLFGGETGLPAGFAYREALITAEEERHLLRNIESLPLKEFQFHGYTGKRRVISFGWKYDFNDRQIRRAEDVPEFLWSLRERAAEFARLRTQDLQHVLVTEYAPGAAIGWHKDKAVFAEVVGVSLASECRFRLRREVGGRWERIAITARPRSVYLLAGEARTQWEHSIPAVEKLRYSITFRRMRDDRKGGMSREIC